MLGILRIANIYSYLELEVSNFWLTCLNVNRFQTSNFTYTFT